MKKKYIVIAHDLGGAEAINKFIQLFKISPLVISSGPADKILFKYESFVGDLFEYLAKLKDEKISFEILIGTGWGDYEINWMKKISEKFFKFSAILDNWVYFKNRFHLSKSQEYIWPEIIYVLDDLAYNRAREKLKGNVPKIINLELNNNYKNFKTQLNQFNPNVNYTLRYISQPLKEINNSKSTLYPDRFPVPNINQHKIFLDLNNNIVPGMKIKYRKWIVNPHPSEDDKSFKKWRSFSQEINSIKFCVENFNENLSEFEIVFGFNSIALLKASFKASFVYSLCDYVNWEEKLPHPQIIYL